MAHPASIGKYDVEEFLGGGMSNVYRAKDRILGRTVCVKVLTAQGTADPEVRERFLQEARMAGNFCHDNVVSIYDFGEDDGNPFLVMEYLRGDTLRKVMNEKKLGGLREVLQMALQLARALECVHAQNIIHRDIKPENVHVNAQGSVKLMDFGIAKARGLNITQAGFILGTPYYMAPEQIRGEDITPAIDVYAFGVLLYEMLAGQKPYRAETPEAIFYAILNQEADRAPLQAAGVPEVVQSLIFRCMSKRADDRPQNFSDIGTQLEEMVTSQSRPTEIYQSPQVAPPPTRPTLWYVIAAVAVLAAAAAVFFVVHGRTVALPKTLASPAGDMVLVPAGAFLYGNPPHQATLPAFYVDKTEVSNAAYASFCHATGCTAPTGDAQLPVTGISVADARRFAQWAGKRLPKAEEWEKAARGTDGRSYPWGNNADASMANLKSGSAVAVNSFSQGASPFGALQMGGNVWEMIDEASDPTPEAVNHFAKTLDPPASASEPWISIRGGSFRTPVQAALTYEFARIPERLTGRDIGFRCVKDPAK